LGLKSPVLPAVRQPHVVEPARAARRLSSASP
jgi:hypothetical protein